MNETTTCCRTPEGITVGLIDGLIAVARVVREREAQAAHDGDYSEAVEHALADLRQDDAMGWLMNWNIKGGVNTLRKIIAGQKRDLQLMTETVADLTKIAKENAKHIDRHE